MTLVIETTRLIEIIDILSATKGKTAENDGILLYMSRGPFGDEPGETDLLAGLSTDGRVSGHYYLPVLSGDITPSFWPASVLGMIGGAFASRAKAFEEGKGEGDDVIEKHAVRLTEMGDGKIQVVEYHAPSDGFEVRFSVSEMDAFPTAGVIRLISGVTSGPAKVAGNDIEIEDGPAELWEANGLGLLLRLAKKWKTRAVIEKSSTTGSVYKVRMEDMDNWRGAVVPSMPAKGETLNSGVESVEVHLDVPGLFSQAAAIAVDEDDEV